MAAVMAADGWLLFANESFRAFFGASVRQLGEIAALRGLFSNDSPRRAALFTLRQRSLLALRIGFRSGHPVPFDLYLFLDTDGEQLESAELQRTKERAELLECILDNCAEDLMFINNEGIVTYVNRNYEEIHHMRAEDAVGRHITEVTENTRLHLVLQTGIPEIAEFQQESQNRYIVNRIPIFRDGKLIGAMGQIVFRDVDRIEHLAAKINRLKSQLQFYRKAPQKLSDTRYSADDIVCNAPSSAKARSIALRVAPSNATVFLLGESGVGKEVYAHAIHTMSLRARGPFVRVNCSAIAENLFESELFGYAEGAFTGAVKGGKPGKFELANYGTIFLDEITDMPLAAQAKLLRVLQEHEIEKLGGGKQTKVDVRVIAATNQDVQHLVDEGRFRKDLFYRLNVIPITIPPLRERVEDIPALVECFWDQLKKEHGIYYHRLDDSALELLKSYSWPGNVRELRNILERALSIVREDTITAEHLRALLLSGQAQDSDGIHHDGTLRLQVEMTERRAIGDALARTNNNRARAAKLLGITRPLLYKKMHLYGMQ
jgi:PAS domain S-box-containing protein